MHYNNPAQTMKTKLMQIETWEKNAIVITIPLNDLKNVITEWLAQTQSNGPVKFLTKREAADKLHISLVTLSKYIRDGIIPAKKIGTRVLIPDNALYKTVACNPTYKDGLKLREAESKNFEE